MPDYKELYFRLFNACTDALTDLDKVPQIHWDVIRARMNLRKAQVDCEQEVIASEPGLEVL